MFPWSSSNMPNELPRSTCLLSACKHVPVVVFQHAQWATALHMSVICLQACSRGRLPTCPMSYRAPHVCYLPASMFPWSSSNMPNELPRSTCLLSACKHVPVVIFQHAQWATALHMSVICLQACSRGRLPTCPMSYRAPHVCYLPASMFPWSSSNMPNELPRSTCLLSACKHVPVVVFQHAQWATALHMSVICLQACSRGRLPTCPMSYRAPHVCYLPASMFPWSSSNMPNELPRSKCLLSACKHVPVVVFQHAQWATALHMSVICLQACSRGRLPTCPMSYRAPHVCYLPASMFPWSSSNMPNELPRSTCLLSACKHVPVVVFQHAQWATALHMSVICLQACSVVVFQHAQWATALQMSVICLQACSRGRLPTCPMSYRAPHVCYLPASTFPWSSSNMPNELPRSTCLLSACKHVPVVVFQHAQWATALHMSVICLQARSRGRLPTCPMSYRAPHVCYLPASMFPWSSSNMPNELPRSTCLLSACKHVPVVVFQHAQWATALHMSVICLQACSRGRLPTCPMSYRAPHVCYLPASMFPWSSSNMPNELPRSTCLLSACKHVPVVVFQHAQWATALHMSVICLQARSRGRLPTCQMSYRAPHVCYLPASMFPWSSSNMPNELPRSTCLLSACKYVPVVVFQHAQWATVLHMSVICLQACSRGRLPTCPMSYHAPHVCYLPASMFPWSLPTCPMSYRAPHVCYLPASMFPWSSSNMPNELPCSTCLLSACKHVPVVVFQHAQWATALHMSVICLQACSRGRLPTCPMSYRAPHVCYLPASTFPWSSSNMPNELPRSTCLLSACKHVPVVVFQNAQWATALHMSVICLQACSRGRLPTCPMSYRAPHVCYLPASTFPWSSSNMPNELPRSTCLLSACKHVPVVVFQHAQWATALHMSVICLQACSRGLFQHAQWATALHMSVICLQACSRGRLPTCPMSYRAPHVCYLPASMFPWSSSNMPNELPHSTCLLSACKHVPVVVFQHAQWATALHMSVICLQACSRGLLPTCPMSYRTPHVCYLPASMFPWSSSNMPNELPRSTCLLSACKHVPVVVFQHAQWATALHMSVICLQACSRGLFQHAQWATALHMSVICLQACSRGLFQHAQWATALHMSVICLQACSRGRLPTCPMSYRAPNVCYLPASMFPWLSSNMPNELPHSTCLLSACKHVPVVVFQHAQWATALHMSVICLQACSRGRLPTCPMSYRAPHVCYLPASMFPWSSSNMPNELPRSTCLLSACKHVPVVVFQHAQWATALQMSVICLQACSRGRLPTCPMSYRAPHVCYLPASTFPWSSSNMPNELPRSTCLLSACKHVPVVVFQHAQWATALHMSVICLQARSRGRLPTCPMSYRAPHVCYLPASMFPWSSSNMPNELPRSTCLLSACKHVPVVVFQHAQWATALHMSVICLQACSRGRLPTCPMSYRAPHVCYLPASMFPWSSSNMPNELPRSTCLLSACKHVPVVVFQHAQWATALHMSVICLQARSRGRLPTCQMSYRAPHVCYLPASMFPWSSSNMPNELPRSTCLLSACKYVPVVVFQHAQWATVLHMSVICLQACSRGRLPTCPMSYHAPHVCYLPASMFPWSLPTCPMSYRAPHVCYLPASMFPWSSSNMPNELPCSTCLLSACKHVPVVVFQHAQWATALHMSVICLQACSRGRLPTCPMSYRAPHVCYLPASTFPWSSSNMPNELPRSTCLLSACKHVPVVVFQHAQWATALHMSVICLQACSRGRLPTCPMSYRAPHVCYLPASMFPWSSSNMPNELPRSTCLLSACKHVPVVVFQHAQWATALHMSVICRQACSRGRLPTCPMSYRAPHVCYLPASMFPWSSSNMPNELPRSICLLSACKHVPVVVFQHAKWATALHMSVICLQACSRGRLPTCPMSYRAPHVCYLPASMFPWSSSNMPNELPCSTCLLSACKHVPVVVFQHAQWATTLHMSVICLQACSRGLFQHAQWATALHMSVICLQACSRGRLPTCPMSYRAPHVYYLPASMFPWSSSNMPNELPRSTCLLSACKHVPVVVFQHAQWATALHMSVICLQARSRGRLPTCPMSYRAPHVCYLPASMFPWSSSNMPNELPRSTCLLSACKHVPVVVFQHAQWATALHMSVICLQARSRGRLPTCPMSYRAPHVCYLPASMFPWSSSNMPNELPRSTCLLSACKHVPVVSSNMPNELPHSTCLLSACKHVPVVVFQHAQWATALHMSVICLQACSRGRLPTCPMSYRTPHVCYLPASMFPWSSSNMPNELPRSTCLLSACKHVPVVFFQHAQWATALHMSVICLQACSRGLLPTCPMSYRAPHVCYLPASMFPWSSSNMPNELPRSTCLLSACKHVPVVSSNMPNELPRSTCLLSACKHVPVVSSNMPNELPRSTCLLSACKHVPVVVFQHAQWATALQMSVICLQACSRGCLPTCPMSYRTPHVCYLPASMFPWSSSNMPNELPRSTCLLSACKHVPVVVFQHAQWATALHMSVICLQACSRGRLPTCPMSYRAPHVCYLPASMFPWSSSNMPNELPRSKCLLSACKHVPVVVFQHAQWATALHMSVICLQARSRGRLPTCPMSYRAPHVCYLPASMFPWSSSNMPNELPRSTCLLSACKHVPVVVFQHAQWATALHMSVICLQACSRGRLPTCPMSYRAPHVCYLPASMFPWSSSNMPNELPRSTCLLSACKHVPVVVFQHAQWATALHMSVICLQACSRGRLPTCPMSYRAPHVCYLPASMFPWSSSNMPNELPRSICLLSACKHVPVVVFQHAKWATALHMSVICLQACSRGRLPTCPMSYRAPHVCYLPASMFPWSSSNMPNELPCSTCLLSACKHVPVVVFQHAQWATTLHMSVICLQACSRGLFQHAQWATALHMSVICLQACSRGRLPTCPMSYRAPHVYYLPASMFPWSSSNMPNELPRSTCLLSACKHVPVVVFQHAQWATALHMSVICLQARSRGRLPTCPMSYRAPHVCYLPASMFPWSSSNMPNELPRSTCLLSACKHVPVVVFQHAQWATALHMSVICLQARSRGRLPTCPMSYRAPHVCYLPASMFPWSSSNMPNELPRSTCLLSACKHVPVVSSNMPNELPHSTCLLSACKHVPVVVFQHAQWATALHMSVICLQACSRGRLPTCPMSYRTPHVCYLPASMFPWSSSNMPNELPHSTCLLSACKHVPVVFFQHAQWATALHMSVICLQACSRGRLPTCPMSYRAPHVCYLPASMFPWSLPTCPMSYRAPHVCYLPASMFPWSLPTCPMSYRAPHVCYLPASMFPWSSSNMPKSFQSSFSHSAWCIYHSLLVCTHFFYLVFLCHPRHPSQHPHFIPFFAVYFTNWLYCPNSSPF